MFCYIDQPCTPSFLIGLVKTESDFIIRSVETGLGRCMLVISVISDQLEDTGIGVFWLHCAG